MDPQAVARVDAHNELLDYTPEQRAWAKVEAALIVREWRCFMKIQPLRKA